MKVILADTAGFCWGVRKAMDKTMDIIHSNTDTQIHTLGPLIHNNQVVEMLDNKGVRVIKKPQDAKEGTVIVRAHGTTPEVLDTLKKSGVSVCNATCPKVGKVQGIIKGHVAKGYDIVIIGDTGHAEVNSLMGYSQNTAYIINTTEEAKKLKNFEKVVVVSQTTFNNETFDNIAKIIEEKSEEAKIFCTICDSTHRRQAEVRRIAKQADCMIIIGGKHSANTVRLAEIASEYTDNVYHIETEEELHNVNLSQFETIGVSAGASTPNWIISSVVNYLKYVNEENSLKFKITGWLFYSGLYRSIAALLLAVGLPSLFDFKFDKQYIVIAFLYMYAMTILNNIIGLESILYNDPTKYHFLQKRKKILVGIAIISLGTLIYISLNISLLVFAVVTAASILGILYRVKFKLKKGYFRLFDIPGSKNFLYAAAWSLVISVLPFIGEKISLLSPAAVLSTILTFTVVFTGSVLFDLKDIQGDKFFGRETLPILIGKHKTSFITYFLTGFTFLSIALYGLLHQNNKLFIKAVVIGFYIGFINYKYLTKSNTKGLVFEISVDGIAIICGIAGIL
jgi:4-hydroxy-3-methylbut-2-enyl diphosphate reductase